MDSIVSILKSSQMDDILLGLSKSECRCILGEPENFYYTSENNAYDKYGSLELRFIDEKLVHIDLAFFNRKLFLPERLSKKYSTIIKGSYTNLHKFSKTLNDLDIEFRVSKDQPTCDEIYLITNENTYARFCVYNGLLNVRVGKCM